MFYIRKKLHQQLYLDNTGFTVLEKMEPSIGHTVSTVSHTIENKQNHLNSMIHLYESIYNGNDCFFLHL